MPVLPQPRFTDLSDLQAYLDAEGKTANDQLAMSRTLVAAERVVERYCRRRFAPEPALRKDYRRQVVSVGTRGPTGTSGVVATGPLAFTYGADTTPPLELPIGASTLRAALTALGSVGAGNLSCAGGPLPAYPVSVYLTGLGASPDLIEVDGSGIGPQAYATVTDAGFDSNPPVAKRFTSRGHKEIRVPDLRLVDAAEDPRVPGSGGIQLYGRRLLAEQYALGYQGYAPGGSDEAFGTGDYAEPATHLSLGYAYGSGLTLAQQFASVLPSTNASNDVWICGRWGWLPTPDDIIHATLAMAARMYRERDAAFSDQYTDGSGATLRFLKELPSAAQAALEGYRVLQIALV